MKIIISSNNIWNLINFRKNLIIKLLKNNYKIYIFTNKEDLKFIKHKNLKIISLNFKSNYNFLVDFYIIIKIFFLYL